MAKKTEKNQEPGFEGNEAFPTIGDDEGAGDEGFFGEFKTREEAEEAWAELQAENERFEEFSTATEKQLDRLQSTVDQLMMGQITPKRAEEKAPEIDFSALPDPVEDKDGFARGVLAQVTNIVSHQSRVTSGAQDQVAQLNALWNDFQDAYPDLVDYGEFIEAETREQAKKVRARGGDMHTILQVNPEGFMESVARGVQKRVDRLGVKRKDEESEDDSDTGRTESVLSGSHGKGGSRGSETSGAGSFVAELKKSQRDSGFF